MGAAGSASAAKPEQEVKISTVSPNTVSLTRRPCCKGVVDECSQLSSDQPARPLPCFRDPEPSSESNGVLSGLALLLTNQKTL